MQKKKKKVIKKCSWCGVSTKKKKKKIFSEWVVELDGLGIWVTVMLVYNIFIINFN